MAFSKQSQPIDEQTPLQAQTRDRRGNAATGASAAGVRAIGSQMIAFYFRAPAKAFFRTRVDYLAFAKAINPRVQANEAWSWRRSTPGLLAHAVRAQGLSFIPNYVFPPLLANVGVGAVLYTSYLQALGFLHQPSSKSLKRVYPAPPVRSTFTAGFTAGAIQSIIAAPLDALQVRFRTTEVLEGKYKNMWHYGYRKLKEIGLRSAFAGWGLSFVKDALGHALFFATFECVKAQGYYTFLFIWYGGLSSRYVGFEPETEATKESGISVVKPHYAIEPGFLMLAGVTASVTQQTIQHPISLVQSVRFRSLSNADKQAKVGSSRSKISHRYCSAYKNTYHRCLVRARRAGGWRHWLYRGFLWNTLKQVPSTSAGLMIFELVRRRYGNETEAMRIEREGYDILLA